MKNSFIPFLLFLFTVINISCSNMDIAAPKSDKHAIISKLKQSSVALIDKREEGALYPECSAVFISQTRILTAYHCAKSYADEAAEAKMDDDAAIFMFIFGELPVDAIGTTIPYATIQEVSEIGESPTKLYNSKVVAIDEDHDLALLQTDGEIPEHEWLHVKEYVPEVGDNVFVEGNPLGLYFTTMPGMISAIRETFPQGGSKSFHVQGPLIQVYSGIWNGNSGGPVISEDGEIIGIVSFILPAPGQGFAISCIQIKHFLIESYIKNH